MEGTSGHGLREMLEPSSAPTVSNASAPPSYDTALDAAKSAPYPTSEPMGMPCPTGAVEAKDFLLYPRADEERLLPLPSRKIGIVPPPLIRIERVTSPSSTIGTYSSPVIPPPARDAPVPLNIRSSNGQPLRSEDSSDTEPCYYIVGSGIIILMVSIILISIASRYY